MQTMTPFARYPPTNWGNCTMRQCISQTHGTGTFCLLIEGWITRRVGSTGVSEPSWTFFTADLCCVDMSMTGWYSILSTSPGRSVSGPNIWSHLASNWKPKDQAQPWEKKNAGSAVCFCSTSSRSQVHTPLLCAAQCEQPGQTSEWKRLSTTWGRIKEQCYKNLGY